jgi:mono/diheme cytochrome c family protein
MKKIAKTCLWVLVCLLVLMVAAISLTIGWRPFIGPRMRDTTDRHFVSTPERVARGHYLAQGLLGCETCHSPKEWTKHGAPIVAGLEFGGQELKLPGFPGTLVASNITPAASAAWTDDQMARAIREGIGHDNRTIFPIMPYELYRHLSDDDLESVVVYLRTVAPVQNQLPPMKVNFPVNYLVRSAPQPVTEPVSGPAAGDPVARGKYLVSVGCGCHSAVDKLRYGGGEHLEGPWGSVTSANISPDASGISYYDEATFIKALRTGYVGARALAPIMPYGELQNLSDDDLKAMFAYLRTVPPIKHRVDNTLPPTYCKVCKQKHGAGDQNQI